jgi:hypothetical protein
MATNYGQLPHFDISKPLFAPLTRIEYGSSAGITRNKLAIRRYTYTYTNNSFVFLKSYKGVRQNPSRITSVVDNSDVNSRSTLHATETLESAPTFLTQSILRSIFAYPNDGGIFFIEGRIKKRYFPPSGRGTLELTGTAPDWFDIYRYGKIINNQIVILKESEEQLTSPAI